MNDQPNFLHLGESPYDLVVNLDRIAAVMGDKLLLSGGHAIDITEDQMKRVIEEIGNRQRGFNQKETRTAIKPPHSPSQKRENVKYLNP